MAGQVKTRILLLSDTHAALPASSKVRNVAYRFPLPVADVAIHTGDLTVTGKIEEHQAAVDLLRSLKAPVKIVIPGNHDLTLDREYYASKGHLWGPRPKYNDRQLDDIKKMYTGADAVSSGIYYLEEGVKTIELANGALLTVYASAYTPEFCQWAFAYPRTDDRFNASSAAHPMPTYRPAGTATSTKEISKDDIRNVDIVMTHGPPLRILDKTCHGQQVGCRHLLQGTARTRPLIHCFGHIHEAWGVTRRSWSTQSEEEQRDRISISEENPDDGSRLVKAVENEPENTINDPTEETSRIDESKALDEMGVHMDATDLQRGRETLFINASIMSLGYEAVQSPWIVDLLLEKK